VTADGPPVGPFSGSYDVLGDGRLLIVPTPGHTPGHLSVIARGETQTWLLAGDLVHSASDLVGRYAAIARWCEEERVEILTAHDRPASGGTT
jgi:glyoxylase-like metal-dependent hydrolase (beta-lactamase superfamily II)